MKTFRIVVSVLWLLSLVALQAAWHDALPLEVSQPDGTQLTIYASGDEFHNWLHDENNYTIVRNDEGAYVYARQDGEGVAATDIYVGNGSPAMRNLEPGINLSPQMIEAKYESMAQMRDYSNGRSPHFGLFNNVVIFIKFSDSPDFARPFSYFEAMFNEEGEDANSMRNYFIEASYNQLFVDSYFYPLPNGDVVVCYTDNQPRSYFQPYSPSNPNGYSGDQQRTQREQQLLVRAVNGVSSQIPTSLVIDGDNDGYVDNVCFIIQGAPDGWAELLWPHRWVLYAASAYIHGKQVWDFNFQLETSLSSSGASVLSHEMFHSLGAPDLYRYSNTSIDPIGKWDLMCSNTNPPQHMGAWMKYRYGEWLPSPQVITQSGTYSLQALSHSETNNAYRIYSWRNNESYVVEYRKTDTFFDSGLPGSGLLVYRLDARQSGNADGPPDELYLYRPNGTTTVNGLINQAHYSQQSGRTEISEFTTPSGFTSTGAAGGLNIYDISEADDTITFKVKISDIQLTYPHGGETWFSGDNKTITWASKSTQGTVNLKYSIDGGDSWMDIAHGAPNSGSYTWYNVPDHNSENMHIQITLLSNDHTDSNVYPFSLIGELATPTALYPENGATDVPTNPQITWQAVPGATGYHFQLSPNEDFSPSLYNVLGHQGNTFQISRLQTYTQYYWRVAAMADVGTSPFCETQSFTTGEISEMPSSPQLLAPSHMAEGLDLPITFMWTPSPLAEHYILQICTSPYFECHTYNYEITNTQFTVHELQPYYMYYWRVAAQNAAGVGYFSQIRRFYTSSPSDSDDHLEVISINKLAANYPNPFNPSTTISLNVKDTSRPLELSIFNLKGQRVRTLHRGLPSSLAMQFVWDGCDDHGAALSSGMYLYRMQTGDYVETRKMLMLK